MTDQLFRGASFLTAAARFEQAPPDEGREVAFAGRSNAGKSSAINTLCGQRRLARTSKTPGRTQQLIFFGLKEGRRLVDLPGYGYAKVSEAVKRQWQDLMAGYLQRRRSLVGLVLVMDVRHPLTAFDQRLLAWTRDAGLPVMLLLTKSDKLKRGASRAQIDRVKGAVAEERDRISVELFSSLNRQGVEAVHGKLVEWLDLNPDDGRTPAS